MQTKLVFFKHNIRTMIWPVAWVDIQSGSSRHVNFFYCRCMGMTTDYNVRYAIAQQAMGMFPHEMRFWTFGRRVYPL